MHENKRLLRHASKVLDTVGFLVDSIGDESKTNQLNEALNNLVESHLRRKIGLTEFRNLGIVLIDFICDVNHRRDISCSKASSSLSSASSSSSSSAANSSSAEKLITDIGSGSSGVVVGIGSGGGNDAGGGLGGTGNRRSYNTTYADTIPTTTATTTTTTTSSNNNDADASGLGERDPSKPSGGEGGDVGGGDGRPMNETKIIDTNGLVAAWTKLYGSILDLVKRYQNASTQIL